MIGTLRSLFWVGVMVLFLPFFGIPVLWKMILIVLVGLFIIYSAIRMRNIHRSSIHRLHHE